MVLFFFLILYLFYVAEYLSDISVYTYGLFCYFCGQISLPEIYTGINRFRISLRTILPH